MLDDIYLFSLLAETQPSKPYRVIIVNKHSMQKDT